jgi:nitrogen-specific signal transduction histidine kinase
VFFVAIETLIALLIYLFLARSINASFMKIIEGISGFSFDQPNTEIQMDKKDVFSLIGSHFNTLISRIDLYKLRIGKLQNDLIKSARFAAAGQVAAGLAHEIRNPLSSIKMMVQIVRSRHLKESSGQEEMSIILEEIDRINGKVKELLEFSRPTPLNLVIQDIHPILTGILKLSEYLIEQNSIILTTDYDTALPELLVDSEKLRICFLNIIMNAIQAMPNGGGLEIRTRIQSDHVSVSICNSWDSDVKLSADELFEPYQTTKREGTGLGLAISKLEIERHHGTIEIVQKDHKVCFDIRLPYGVGDKEM